MRKISITEALNELKLYDSKIMKAIDSAVFVGATKKSDSKVGVIDRDVFCVRAKASYQSIVDLISNRNALKSAIVQSNAITYVIVNGKTMTVAEAIERKKSIEYEVMLLDEMKKQYARTTDTISKENKKVDNKIDELLATLIGKDTSKEINKESQEAIEIPYRNKNEYEMVDPVDLLNKIEALEEEIDGFMSEVDTRLSVINSTTLIELDF